MAPVTVRVVDAPRRHRTPGRTHLLLVLVPALVGGAAAAGFVGGAATAVSTWVGAGDGAALALTAPPCIVLLALPVLWARSAPLVAAAALSLLTGLEWVAIYLLGEADVLLYPTTGTLAVIVLLTSFVAAFPVSYAAARHRDAPVLVAVLAILTLPVASMILFVGWQGELPVSSLLIAGAIMIPGYGGLLTPVWWVGLVRGRRVRREAESARRNAERAERAVRDERARVLRELQGLDLADLASIGEQAERAGRVLATDGADPAVRADARAALQSMTATGRDTLTAMRRLLGMLRTTEPDGVPAPQPTLDRLDELVEDGRRAGLDVRVTVSGERRALPDDVDLAAYRLLQRVLAGCGAAVPVRLQVGYADRALRLVVRGDVAEDSGVAVREWVRMVGGEVVSGPGPSVVEVRLPIGRARAA